MRKDEYSSFLIVSLRYLPADSLFCPGELVCGHSAGVDGSLTVAEAIGNGVCVTVPLTDVQGSRAEALSRAAESLKSGGYDWLHPEAEPSGKWKFHCTPFVWDQEAWTRDELCVPWLAGIKVVNPQVDDGKRVIRFVISASAELSSSSQPSLDRV